jgi:PST family polysaccharide transporter
MPDTPSDVAAGHRDVDAQLVRGIAWTGGAKWLVQIFSWASMVALARLLKPSDFGLVGLAGIYLGLVGMVTEFGLGTSILALRDLDRHRVAQLNTVALGLGLTGAAATWIAAVPMGRFFNAPALPLVMLALSATFLMGSLRTVPVALLQKELRFRTLGLIEALQATVTIAASLVLAALGKGYWSLVFNNIIGTAVGTALLHLVRPHPFAVPRLSHLGESLGFSTRVLVSRLSWYVYSNSDFAVAGRVLGLNALGLYRYAWEIASVPVDKITALVTRVTPAFVARLQADPKALRRIVLRLTEGLLLVTLPASIGMALVADHFVLVAFGEKWAGAALPLALLSIFTSFRSVVTMLPQVLTVRGETRMLMWNGVVTALLLPLAFWVGARWGAAGVAAVWIVAYPWSTVQLYRRTFKTLDLSLGEYLGATWLPLRGTIVMAVAVAAARLLLPDSLPVAVRLGVEAGVGALVYLVAGVLPQRDRVRRLMDLARGRGVGALETGESNA